MRTVKQIFAESNYACAIERQRRHKTSATTALLVSGVVVACAIVGIWLGGLWTA